MALSILEIQQFQLSPHGAPHESKMWEVFGKNGKAIQWDVCDSELGNIGDLPQGHVD